MVRTGVDLIEIERVAAAIDRFGPRFLERIFTPAELAVCANKVDSLAVRFAAKEAVAKALGAGIWRTGIDWTDIEVLAARVGRAAVDPARRGGGAVPPPAHQPVVAQPQPCPPRRHRLRHRRERMRNVDISRLGLGRHP